MVDIIKAERIAAFLTQDLKNQIKIEVLEKIESTNTLLRAYADNGAGEGLVIIAGEQTAGRGRMGRSFFSPGDAGVYMSVLLKPQIKPEDAVQITTAAAVGVSNALDKMGVVGSKIKWVNDIYINSKKVCGILTEGNVDVAAQMLNYAILGVGVNIYEAEDGFPEEIKNIAGAVFPNRVEDLRNKFIALFLNEFFDFYKKLSSKAHLEEYRRKSFVLGENIVIHKNGTTQDAKAIDVDENCNLVVEFLDGRVENLCSGEISIRLSTPG